MKDTESNGYEWLKVDFVSSCARRTSSCMVNKDELPRVAEWIKPSEGDVLITYGRLKARKNKLSVK